MAIKKNLGKLEYPESFTKLEYIFIANFFDLLPIKFIHNEVFSKLPLHHKAPFDRMIIAQAMTEDFQLLRKTKSSKITSLM